jgi:hypothetical protein
MQFHVPIPTRDQDVSRSHFSAIGGFVHPELAAAVETLCQQSGEQLGHMLDY